MKLESLQRAIVKLGGTAIIGERNNGPSRKVRVLTGSINSFDISMWDNTDYFTARHESKRGHFDAGSDYNSGGYDFCNRIKDIEDYAPRGSRTN